eukprot:CAMPEP_0202816930 /NCGR_PEP_ID=MMETSP1389-20130828/7278_1 /ASSEMBLY_ACC=CAM_ASM_000865 /TAXON_ID=302021 /ORGANISM="Rhodomonas sp., Strain CCMP768" /LENGTH=59 /DNA_ID=CAMNT_0049489057 /DNA_START=1 /DNA_END=177 /DNA_ORIENTATION=+
MCMREKPWDCVVLFVIWLLDVYEREAVGLRCVECLSQFLAADVLADQAADYPALDVAHG